MHPFSTKDTMNRVPCQEHCAIQFNNYLSDMLIPHHSNVDL